MTTVDVTNPAATTVIVEDDGTVTLLTQLIAGPAGPAGADGAQGPPGPQGPPGSGVGGTHLHVQAIASDEWLIVHNLGFRPGGILVQDSAMNNVEGDITHLDINTVRINFSAAFAGEAYLS